MENESLVLPRWEPDATIRPDVAAGALMRMVCSRATLAEALKGASDWQIRIVGRLIDSLMGQCAELGLGTEHTIQWRQYEPRVAAIVDAALVADRDGVIRAIHRANVIYRETVGDLVRLVCATFPNDDESS